MGRGRSEGPVAVSQLPKERHRRALQPRDVRRTPADVDFADPRPKKRPSKLNYHTYYEIVENQDRKAKLSLLKSFSMKPPPQFEFVPAGNPKLTEACKEASRQWGFAVYIVATNDATTDVAEQMLRIGFHFHSFVMERVKTSLPDLKQLEQGVQPGRPEPIPESLALYQSQVDAALRDLFPRIPNTDRDLIIQRAFSPRTTVKGSKTVGFNDSMPLARRVQLATIAHVRHRHTRYDEFLKKGFLKPEVRKVIQGLCLEILVKWRGDEENGRDQLDEVLREVIVIPDDSDDDSEGESSQGSSGSKASATASLESMPSSPQHAGRTDRQSSGDDDETPEPMALPAMDGAAPRVPQGRAPEPGDQSGLPIWVGVAQRDPVPRRPLYYGDGHNHQFAAQRTPGTDSRQLPWNAGCAPAPNGHVPQGTQEYHRLPEDVCPAPDSAAPAPVYAAHGEVEFVAREQSARDFELYQRAPGYHVQDTVVRSIEPAYPDPSQPTFVRSLPAGPQYGLPHGRSRASSRQLTWGEFGSVMSDHLPRERAQSTSFQAAAPFHPPPGSTPVTLPYRPARVDEPTRSSGRPAADRIVLNACRPGTRSNPILMEDRGGFYERVSPSPELVPPQAEACRVSGVRRPFSQVLRTPAYGNDGALSPHPDSRFPQASQVPMGLEISINSRFGVAPPVFEVHGVSGPDYTPRQPLERGPLAGSGRPWPRHGYRLHSRPVSGDCRSSFPRPYHEGLPVDDRSVLLPPQHSEQDPRGHHEWPLAVDYRGYGEYSPWIPYPESAAFRR